MASQDNLFRFVNPLFKKRRRDGALIDVKERDVVVSDFVKQDDELHEVGVGLLPEGFFAFAEEIIEQRSDVECEGIGVEVVVQRVVAVLGVRDEISM